MNAAVVAWIVVGGLVGVLILVGILINIPEMRRYLRIRRM